MRHSVLFTVILKALTNQRATAFQTLDRKVRQHSSTDLFLSSYQSVVARPLPSEAEQGKLNTRHRQDAIKTVIGDRSRLSKTVPSGQKQLPWHVRIAKVWHEHWHATNIEVVLICIHGFSTLICSIFLRGFMKNRSHGYYLFLCQLPYLWPYKIRGLSCHTLASSFYFSSIALISCSAS